MSASPRRRELLGHLIATFATDSADIDEAPLEHESPMQTAERLAIAKAKVGVHRFPGCLIIAGDTVVTLQTGDRWVQYGKPESESDARRMLGELSGKEHFVITGIALAFASHSTSAFEQTRVRFKSLDPASIADYVAQGESLDKAGAYAMQGKGSHIVESFEGSWSNIVGLPLELLNLELQRFIALLQSLLPTTNS